MVYSGMFASNTALFFQMVCQHREDGQEKKMCDIPSVRPTEQRQEVIGKSMSSKSSRQRSRTLHGRLQQAWVSVDQAQCRTNENQFPLGSLKLLADEIDSSSSWYLLRCR